MSVPAQGRLAFVQMEKETTFGTYIAPTKKFEIISFSAKGIRPLIKDTSLYNGRSPRGYFAGGFRVEGKITVRLNFEGMLKMMEGWAWGLSTAVVGGETQVWDHTIKEGLSSVIPSYTMEVCEGDPYGNGKVARVLGTVFESCIVRWQAAQSGDVFLTAELGFAAKDIDTNFGNGYTPAATFTMTCTASTSTPILTTAASFQTAGVAPNMLLSGTMLAAGARVGRILSATSLTVVDANGNDLNGTSATPGTVTFTLNTPRVLPILFHSNDSANAVVDDGTDTIVGGGGGSGGSPNITTTNSFVEAGIVPGMAITGTGVGAGAVVQSITNATTLVATVNNSGTVSGNLTFKQTVRVTGGEITINQPLDKERFYTGATTPDQALPNDFLDVSWRITQEFRDYGLYQLFRQFTPLSPRFVFEDPNVLIGATSKRQFEIKSGTTYIDDYDKPVENYGKVIGTVTQKAQLDTADAAAVVMRFRSYDAWVN